MTPDELEAFDEAALAWGYERDEGYGVSVSNARNRYDAAKAELAATITTLTAERDAARAERDVFADRVFRYGFWDGWTANQRGRLAAPAAVDEAWHFYVANGALQKSIEAATAIKRGEAGGAAPKP